MVLQNRSGGGRLVKSIVYACVAAVVIAVAVAVIIYVLQGPPGADYAIPGTVRL
jgi:hypothetical protein